MVVLSGFFPLPNFWPSLCDDKITPWGVNPPFGINIQPRDFELLIKPDGHLIIVDAGMFVDMTGVNVDSQTRLSGLNRIEKSLQSIGVGVVRTPEGLE